MVQIEVTNRWHKTSPGAHVGVLLIGKIDNTRRETPLEARKRAVEARLRENTGFTRAELLEVKVLRAYRDFYKRFGNIYHVQLQLESTVKGKLLPSVSPLVDANFAAELETLVFTAGHDADLLTSPLTLDATGGGEAFTGMNGAVKTLKPGDMMRGAHGMICTIIAGQDARTPISEATRRALYMAYAPSGVPVEAAKQQLESIRQNVLLFAPKVEVELFKVYAANGPEAYVWPGVCTDLARRCADPR